MTELTCFKAYDIRGQLGTELDEGVATVLAVPMLNFYSQKALFWVAMSG
jgi:hypothetical protein